MMKDKKKIAQPCRSPGDYQWYLNGVLAVATAFGYRVNADSWGGGIPNELTLVKVENKPEPVVTVEILEHTAETSRRVEVVPEAGEQLRVVKDDAEPDAGT